jgi:hypothetical protein
VTWAPDYAQADDLKAYERIDDTVDDAQIALAITAASRAVDRHCNRQFGAVAAPEERWYTAHWDRFERAYVIPVDDLQTETGLSSTVLDSFTVGPKNAVAKGKAWTRLVTASVPTCDPEGIAVTGTWGWTDVPTPIVQATLLQASRFLARRQAPFGVAGSPELGSEMRLLAKVDPDVAVALGPYMRWWGAA